MIRQLLKPALLAAFVTIAPAPAMAQVRVNLPGLEIHMGHRAPPAPRYERRTRRPGRDYVWLGGAWDWQGNDWAWAPGRWDRASQPGSRWIRPQYRREGDAWRVEPGHWSHQQLVEGDDYRSWRADRDRNRGRDDRNRDRDDRNRDRDRDRDHDRDRDRDHDDR